MNDNYAIRPFEEKDEEQLIEVWGPSVSTDENEGRLLFKPSSADPFVHCLTATEDNFPVGVGSLAQARLDPRYLWEYIEVDSSQRNQGIAHKLAQDLYSAGQEKQAELDLHGVRAKVTPGEPGEKFARDLGFTVFQDVTTYVLEPSSIKADQNVLAQDGPLSVDASATGSVELTQSILEFYQKTQQTDAGSQPPLGRIQQVFLSPETGAFGALVVREKESSKILATAVSYPTAEDVQKNMAREEFGEDQSEATAELEQAPATRVLISYATQPDDDPHIKLAVQSLLSLLVYRQAVELEVPEKATVLEEIISEVRRQNPQGIHAINLSRIVYKNF